MWKYKARNLSHAIPGLRTKGKIRIRAHSTPPGKRRKPSLQGQGATEEEHGAVLMFLGPPTTSSPGLYSWLPV